MLDEIQRERGIHKEALLGAIKASLLSAAKKRFKTAEDEEDGLTVDISEEGEVRILKEDKDVTPKDFGRLAAQTAKQVIIQRIREAEKDEIFEEYAQKQGDLITGIIQRREYGGYLINLGRIETILPVTEQIPGEILRERDHVKLYLVETRKTPKGPSVIISRAHPGLIKKLFELEVPELKDGTLEIKAIAREPGRRTKIAILSNDKNVGAVGTCVGHMGARIQNIIREIGPERIDIIEWSDNPIQLISHALSPAKVGKVEINKEEQSAKVYVSNKELSLAIGKEGQNVRLAAKLTGWKIDVRSDRTKQNVAPEESEVKEVADSKVAEVEEAAGTAEDENVVVEKSIESAEPEKGAEENKKEEPRSETAEKPKKKKISKKKKE